MSYLYNHIKCSKSTEVEGSVCHFGNLGQLLNHFSTKVLGWGHQRCLGCVVTGVEHFSFWSYFCDRKCLQTWYNRLSKLSKELMNEQMMQLKCKTKTTSRSSSGVISWTVQVTSIPSLTHGSITIWESCLNAVSTASLISFLLWTLLTPFNQNRQIRNYSINKPKGLKVAK